MHEERVIRPRTNHSDFDAIFRIPACKAVETIEPLARVEIVKRALAVDLECAFVARNIYWSPPDVVFRRGMLDHTLVLWRTPRLDSRVGDERAVLGNARVFLKTNRVFIERARLKIMMHVGDGETVLLESEYDRVHGVHLHWSCNSTVLAQPRAPAYRTKLLVVPGPSGLPTSTPPKIVQETPRS